jgi:hypothetical protein
MAKYEELFFDQGSDVAVEIHVTDENNAAKDLSNYSVAAKMKKTYNTSDSDATSFNAIVSQPAEDGIITLTLTNQQTDALKAGRYVYDVEISFEDSDGATVIERILEGKIEVSPSVTR